MNNKAVKIIILVAIIIVVLAVVVLGFILGVKLLSKKCQPLTPLALRKFEMAGGERPEQGEKCDIAKNSYLLKLVYDDSSAAERARTGLELVTPGEVGEIEKDVNWIVKDGNSSLFWTDKKKLGVLVIIGQDKEKDVEKQLDKAFKRLE